MNFDPYIDKILAAEGGFVDNSSDRGGPTRYGITQAVARFNGWTGSMQTFPESLARSIYLKRYITEPAFDKIASVNEPIAAELIDTGVNMGPATAAQFLQRWLNGFNAGGSRYADLFVDGRIGPASIAALAAFLKWRGRDGETAMLRGLNGVQAAKYLALAEGSKSQRDFLFGWVMNRVS